MPTTIEIPDTLAFTKVEALAALEADVQRRQGQVRQQIAVALREARNSISSEEATPDEQVPTIIATLRETLATLRQEFLRLGKVEAELKAQWQAAQARGPV